MRATLIGGIPDVCALGKHIVVGRGVAHILGGRTLKHSNSSTGFRFYGQRAVLRAFRETKVWDVPTGNRIATLKGRWWVTPNGLYALSVYEGVVRVWDMDKAQIIREFGQGYFQLKCSDDTYVVVDNKVWNFMDGTFCYELHVATHDIVRATIQDNYLIAHGHGIWVFDLLTGNTKYTIYAESCLFKTTRDYLLTGTSERLAQLWDIHTGKLLQTWEANVQYETGQLTNKYVAFMVTRGSVFVYNIVDHTSCTITSDHIYQIYVQDDILFVYTRSGTHKFKLYSPLLPAFAISLALDDGDGAYFRELCRRL